MNHNTLVDIFFVVTGVAVVILTILLAIGIIYLYTIFRTIKRIVRTAEFATEVVREDIAELRSNIKERGLNLAAFLSFFKEVGKRRILPKRKK